MQICVFLELFQLHLHLWSFATCWLLFSGCSRLLECLFVLLSTGAMASQSSVFVVTRRVIQTLLQSQEGLLFLSARPDTTNGIIRSLVQMTVGGVCEQAFRGKKR